MMYPAIFARTYPIADAAGVLAASASDGYDGVQFNLVCAGLASLPVSLPDGLGEQIGDMAKATGQRLSALSGTYNMAHPDRAVRAEARARFANVAIAARQMECPIVTLCTGSRNATDMWKYHSDNSSPGVWRDFREELDHLLILAEWSDIKLAIEPEPGNVVSDATRARQLLDEVRSPRIGIILDAANLLPPENLPRQHAIMNQAIDLLGESILIAHAKDIDANGNVVAAGEGVVDLTAFVAGLKSVGFGGALVGHGFEVSKTKSVARTLRRLIEVVS